MNRATAPLQWFRDQLHCVEAQDVLRRAGITATTKPAEDKVPGWRIEEKDGYHLWVSTLDFNRAESILREYQKIKRSKELE
jgi:hypothetical protein